MLKCYVVGGSVHYINWINNSTLVKKIEDADLVVFTGGEDVSPNLYKEPMHPRTHSNALRDAEETFYFNKAQALKIPCLGICRGSQLLCVLSGGKLVQDQKNPAYIHEIKNLATGECYEISSTHHQAQYPYNLNKKDYVIIAAAEPQQSEHHHDGKQNELYPEYEVEICYYPKTNCLGIQGHPEDLAILPKSNISANSTTKTLAYLNGLLDEYLFKVKTPVLHEQE